jgi:tripartite-type tricarboxylate transporter receptor subunit TctC
MGVELGQTVVVENKPGAGTVIGMDAVAKSAPDGYTLVMATFPHAVNTSMLPKLPYHPVKAFAPISLVAKGPNVLVVRADSPFKTVQDVLAAAKARPGQLGYASQGNGTSAHLAGEMFTNLAKVNMVHVPYRGAGPAMTDLLGGQVDLIFGTAAAVAGLIESGKLRALAVTSAAPYRGVERHSHGGRHGAGLCRRKLVRSLRRCGHAARGDRQAGERRQESRAGASSSKKTKSNPIELKKAHHE